MKKVFLDELPKRNKNGKKRMIDWKNSIGYKVPFIYNDVVGEFKIINYFNGLLTLKYNVNISNITINNFINAKIGGIIGCINIDYLYSVGNVIDMRNGNVKIVDVKRIKVNNSSNERGYVFLKGYSVKCLKCGYIYDITENDIATSKSSGCKICHDNISYPEKFISCLLSQIGIKYKRQMRFKWARKNCGEVKIYDFYFEVNGLKVICECHGAQHFIKSFETVGGRTLQEEQENDIFKRNLALYNNIDIYIELDCRESSLEWIKKSILNSKLNELFDLNVVDWEKCGEFAVKNLVHSVCDKYKELKNVQEISEYFNVSTSVIRKYLNLGKELGFCSYDSIKEKEYSYKKMHNANKKRVYCEENGLVYECTKDVITSLNFKNTRGIEESIRKSIRENKQYRGFTFKYVEK